MAFVRVFLCTYKRPHLLRRALSSLLAQTFTDWVCELHNDAPGDDSPRQVLEELAGSDPRFTYHPHPHNWGAVATFNHAFAGGSEDYATLLEDDNWWEPAFLASAIAALDAERSAAFTWANMRLWQENADGSWANTSRAIWTVTADTAPVVSFRGPEMIQAITALHSNGAMVFRPDKFAVANVPASTPFAIIESLRERAARGPMLLLTKPLANFAMTLTTARGDDRNLWLQSKLLVASSFFLTTTVDQATLSLVWASQRAARPRDTGMLFLVAIALRWPRLVRPATAADWFKFILGSVRHPRAAWKGLRFRQDHRDVWEWLLAQSSRSAPLPTAHCTLLAKSLPAVA